MLLDEDMEFVRLDEEDTEAGGEGNNAVENTSGAADSGEDQAQA